MSTSCVTFGVTLTPCVGMRYPYARMGEDQRRAPWAPSAGDTSAARQRAIELRLEEIAAEIARLRRERDEAIQDFRAFTGKPTAGPADADADPAMRPTGVRQSFAGTRGPGTLETYAAELADRGPLVSSRFGLFQVPHDAPHVDPAHRGATHKRSRGALRIIVPVLVLGAVAAGVSAIVGWRADRLPAEGRGQAYQEGATAPATSTLEAGAVPAAGVDRTLPSPAATSGTTGGRPLTLELTTVRDVWMRTTIDDQPPSSRVLPAGDTMRIEADRFVEVRLGDAGAVTLRLNGEDRGLLGRDGEVLTRRFEADRDRPEP